MTTALVIIEFHGPRPPDGLPNYRPNGSHTYRIRDEEHRLLLSGTFGPDKQQVLPYVLVLTREKGFSHYRVDPNAPVVPIPNEIVGRKPCAPKLIYFEGMGHMEGVRKWSWRSLGYRVPKKGEHYLSGAIVQAYKAPNDLLSPYWIVEPVQEHVQRMVWVPKESA